MAENDNDQERTERPTAKRLEKAREEGHVPRSAELSAAAVLLVAGAGLRFLGGSIGAHAVRHHADRRCASVPPRRSIRGSRCRPPPRSCCAALIACAPIARPDPGGGAGRAARARRLESQLRGAGARLRPARSHRGLRPLLLRARRRRARQGVRQVPGGGRHRGAGAAQAVAAAARARRPCRCTSASRRRRVSPRTRCSPSPAGSALIAAVDVPLAALAVLAEAQHDARGDPPGD